MCDKLSMSVLLDHLREQKASDAKGVSSVLYSCCFGSEWWGSVETWVRPWILHQTPPHLPPCADAFTSLQGRSAAALECGSRMCLFSPAGVHSCMLVHWSRVQLSARVLKQKCSTPLCTVCCSSAALSFNMKTDPHAEQLRYLLEPLKRPISTNRLIFINVLHHSVFSWSESETLWLIFSLSDWNQKINVFFILADLPSLIMLHRNIIPNVFSTLIFETKSIFDRRKKTWIES